VSWRRVVDAPGAPRPLGPYSQAIRAGDLVFCAGQIGVDPGTGRLVAGGVLAELDQALDNLTAVLEAAGLGLEDVVKVTLFLADLGAGAAVNARWGERFAEPRPARSTVQVAALPAGALVEVDAIASRGG
jgi:2-iminobutanoate/2-iminopropanoate deaminase